MSNVFKEIREKAEARSELREKIKKQYNRKNERRKDRANNIKDIAKLATEFHELMQDSRYPGYMKYLKGIQEEYKIILQTTTLAGDFSEQAITAAACISLIDIIINYPVTIIDEFDKVNKK